MPAAGAVYDPAGYVVHGQNATSQQFSPETSSPSLPARPDTIEDVIAILVANGLCK